VENRDLTVALAEHGERATHRVRLKSSYNVATSEWVTASRRRAAPLETPAVTNVAHRLAGVERACEVYLHHSITGADAEPAPAPISTAISKVLKIAAKFLGHHEPQALLQALQNASVPSRGLLTIAGLDLLPHQIDVHFQLAGT
jgi:hypothetical protein